jgi:UDPglucose 6-dehydrogenase/GDP-mannose 6-dehydrogenase
MISFANEFAALCDALGGVDIADVMRGVHAARYFQLAGAGERQKAPITSFLWAGCGYGGSCLPKDTQALVAHAAAHGVEMQLLRAVIERNAAQPARVIDIVRRHYASLSGLKVAVLGLAFKEDTDDVRESPAIPILLALVEAGCMVTAYDPVARDSARAALPGLDVRIVDTLAQAVAAQDALVIATRWDEFRALPDLLRGQESPPLVIDGRRMLEPASISRYAGIGAGVAPAVRPSPPNQVEHV